MTVRTLVFGVGTFIMGCLLTAWLSYGDLKSLFWTSTLAAVGAGLTILAIFVVNFCLAARDLHNELEEVLSDISSYIYASFKDEKGRNVVTLEQAEYLREVAREALGNMKKTDENR